MWDNTHLPQWESIMASIRPKIGKGPPRPIDIWHPNTAINNIKSISVESISTSQPDEHQIWTVTLNCIEYFKPPKLIVTDTATTSVGNIFGVAANGAPPAPIGPPPAPIPPSSLPIPT
jgi:hypothetical protein